MIRVLRWLGQAPHFRGARSNAIRRAACCGVALSLIQPTEVLAQLDISRYVTIRAGQAPIILSAPHGGDRLLPGVPERTNAGQRFFELVRDQRTAELVDRIAYYLARRHSAAPYVVIARFERRHVDANRAAEDAYTPPGDGGPKLVYDAFHNSLAGFSAEVAARWGRGIMLDIHGQSRRPEAVIRGTDDGETVASLIRRHGEAALIGPNSIFGALAAKGYTIAPTGKADDKLEQLFRGGPIVRMYGSWRGGAIDAIQVEVGSRYRAPERLEQTARDMSDAIATFTKAYLPRATAK